MAAFDRYYVPGVTASVDANDTEIGITTPPYDGGLEADWANVGTNVRLQAIDASVVSWNAAALGTTSRRLDLSSWVRETSGEAMSTDVPANLNVTGLALGIDGTVDVTSLDTTQALGLAGIRQQAAGGIFSPPDGSGLPQFFMDGLIYNGGAGVGTYPISLETVSTDARCGLSPADALTVLRSSTMLVRLFISNETSTVFIAKMDRFRLRVVGTVPDEESSTVMHLRRRWDSNRSKLRCR